MKLNLSTAAVIIKTPKLILNICSTQIVMYNFGVNKCKSNDLESYYPVFPCQSESPQHFSSCCLREFFLSIVASGSFIRSLNLNLHSDSCKAVLCQCLVLKMLYNYTF